MSLAAGGMRESDLRRVQAHGLGSHRRGLRMAACLIGQIEWIADDRMPQVPQMDADLMRATGYWCGGNQRRAIAVTAQYFESRTTL